MTHAPSTSDSLLFRLRDPQDHQAWLEFVTLYEPVMHRLLRRFGLQDADARELMQELFLAVSRNIGRWDPARERGSFRGWLQRVARNLVVNLLKRRHRQPIAGGSSDLQELLDKLPAPDGPESIEFDREVRRARFRTAADQVRREVQPATWQAFWETSVVGIAQVDAAAKLGISIGALRVARSRVLARLRTAVAELEKS
jgi:RNA polymerase sigma factor (sigma-70 family)